MATRYHVVVSYRSLYTRADCLTSLSAPRSRTTISEKDIS